MGVFFEDRRGPHPIDGVGLEQLVLCQLLVLCPVSVMKPTGSHSVRLGGGNPFMCEPYLLPDLLLVVNHSSEGICSYDLTSGTAKQRTGVMVATLRHGRDGAAEPCNGGGGEKSSDWNYACEFIFIAGNNGLADGRIADKGGGPSHAARRGHFTGGIEDRPHPRFTIHRNSDDQLGMGWVCRCDIEYVGRVEWPVEIR